MGYTTETPRQLVGRRLVFNILWCGIHISLFIIGWYKQANDQRLAILNLLRFSVWISRGSGLCLCLDGFLLFLPGLKLDGFMRPKLGWLIPVDQNIWFHRQVAYTTLLFSAYPLVLTRFRIHTTAHYVNMLNVERTQPGGITGHVMLLIMNRKIRRECLKLLVHHPVIAFFWALAFYTHATVGVAYFLDRLCREIRGRRSCKIIAVLVHPSGTVEIRMQKPSLKYIPGQWIFFQMPEISRFQWHPFTLSSAPDDPYISIHIDGPYGAPAQDVFKCEVAVLIGAGIGVTPFSSILKNIYYLIMYKILQNDIVYKQQQGNLGALRKVQFIWLNKNIASFSWFRSLLKDLEDIQTNASFLRMDMYLTGVVDEDTISNLSRTHFGRPHWARDIFGPIKQAINSGNWYGVEMALQTKVGVFYCEWTDTPLAKQLKDECRDATTSNVRLIFTKSTVSQNVKSR
ncbi:NADPH oxidase [Phakopsora pachyrhizi]|uniref:NADPH oxidase n=1 Tax=Phakopsora pachyrhizi TaxID=170000 RepID=A0AAV0BI38_PHAPC|nr:NADPH oxidase [Phakopsora pachyrhizi]